MIHIPIVDTHDVNKQIPREKNLLSGCNSRSSSYSSPVPQIDLVFSAFFWIRNEKVGSFPNIIWRHFTHAPCRGTGSINEFLYAIGSRGVGRIRDNNANPRRCFGLEYVSRILPASHAIKWRNERKSLLLHYFWSMLIHGYQVQLGCLLQLAHFV